MNEAAIESRRPLLLAFLLTAAGWLLYLPSVNYDFVHYDDVRILRDHPELYGNKNFAENLRAIFVEQFPREEPLLLRDVTWALDSRIFGFGNPRGYHLTNVFLNGVVTALGFILLLNTTRKLMFSFSVALGWLLLAAHIEPVAWIMGRKDILSAMFMLLALLAQTQRLRSDTIGRQALWHLAMLICLLAGLLSKISVLTFPLVLLLHAVFFPYLTGTRAASEPFPWNKKFWIEAAWSVPAWIMSFWIYGWYRHTIGEMGVLDRGYDFHGWSHLWNLWMVNPFVIVMYVQQMIFPSHLRVFYTWPEMVATFPTPQMLVAMLLTFAALLLGIILFRRRKDLFFCVAAFFVLMVPYLNLVYSGILIAERYVYFSSLFLMAILVALVAKIFSSSAKFVRMTALAGCLISFVANAFQFFTYQPAWRNGETLWQYHLTLPNNSVDAYANLAGVYYAEAAALVGKPEMALAVGKMGVVVDAGLKQFYPDPQLPPPTATWQLFFMKSIVQEVQGELQTALASLLIADRAHPHFAAINLNLALLYGKLSASAEGAQKHAFAISARDRYAQYIAYEFRGRPAPANIQKQLEDFEKAAVGDSAPQ